jgi:hypothetical protein
MRCFLRIILTCIVISLLTSCKTVNVNKEVSMASPLKYPIVLVHGIIAHDRGGIINFWGRIPNKLQENNIKVFF